MVDETTLAEMKSDVLHRTLASAELKRDSVTYRGPTTLLAFLRNESKIAALMANITSQEPGFSLINV